MSKMVVVEIQRQPVGIEITQSLNVVIPTIGVEIIVAPIIIFVRSGILIRSVANLGHGLGGVLLRMNFSRSSKIPLVTTRVLGTP